MNEIGKIDCSECKYFQFDEDYEGNDMSWCSKSNDLYTECCEDFTDINQAEAHEYQRMYEYYKEAGI
jgi:hypothetical protein